MSVAFRLLLATSLLGIAGAFAAAQVPAERQVRELPTFTAVSLGTSATVVVRQGSPQRVTVEADPADLPKLQTEVAGGRLRVERRQAGGRDEASARLQGPVTVYVTLPAITGLAAALLT